MAGEHGIIAEASTTIAVALTMVSITDPIHGAVAADLTKTTISSPVLITDMIHHGMITEMKALDIELLIEALILTTA